MNKFGFVCLAFVGFVLRDVSALDDNHKSLIQSKFITTGMGCLKDHPLSFSDINTLRKKMLPDGANAKCFAECLFKKLGVVLTKAYGNDIQNRVPSLVESWSLNLIKGFFVMSGLDFRFLGLPSVDMDDMGKLSSSGAKENAMQIFKDSEEHLAKVEEFVKTCSSVNDMDFNEAALKSCDRAKLAFKCLVDNAPKFGFDVDF